MSKSCTKPASARSSLRSAFTAVVATAALLPCASAQAQTSARSATEILRSLAPIDGQTHAGSPRAAPSHESRRTIPYVDRFGRQASIVADYRHAIDLTVFFAYNSDELVRNARIQLDALGRALRSERLRPYRFMIAGHTDAIGSPEFNRELSFRRADAVVRYLVHRFGIDPDRLVVVGWGSSQLKLPHDPLHAANRRVEVVLVADPSTRLGPAADSGLPGVPSTPYAGSACPTGMARDPGASQYGPFSGCVQLPVHGRSGPGAKIRWY